MSFFDPALIEPVPEPPQQEPPVWIGPPHHVLPVFSTQRAIMARNDRVVVMVDQFSIYETGLTFMLTLLKRHAEDDHRHGPPWEMIRRRPDKELPDDFLRLGVAFSDGSKWTNLEPMYPDPETEVTGPVVMSQGGGGGGNRWRMRQWLWPLPPPGPLTMVISWPSEGIAETSVELDATEFRQLAEQAEQLWPD